MARSGSSGSSQGGQEACLAVHANNTFVERWDISKTVELPFFCSFYTNDTQFGNTCQSTRRIPNFKAFFLFFTFCYTKNIGS